MPLSVAKLKELLLEKGFYPTKYFLMDNTCFYIELFSIKSSDTFLLYIPSKYNIPMKSQEDTFKIKYIDVDEMDMYAEKPTDMNIDNMYGKTMNLTLDDNKLEETLENNYKHEISLTDISKEDAGVIRTLYRQMKRLKYSVQTVRYKIGVFYKNYLCAIRRDDDIHCFSIKHFSRESDTKKMMIIVDLETFYEKDENILEDIQIVRNGVYNVLERNHGVHTQVMARITENKKDIELIPEQVNKKMRKYENILRRLDSQLKIILEAEQKYTEELGKLQKEGNPPSTFATGIHTDISSIHERTRLLKEIDKINAIKNDISNNITIVRGKLENTILAIDNIMFDNSVMFDSIIKNFSKLKEFC